MLASRLPKRDIVLAGAGHTHAHVLRMWRMAPLADVRLTCVSPYAVATYSGMLPGTLAGLYEPEQMQIDLARLCAAAGVRLIVASVSGIDMARRELQLEDRPALPFDLLSLGIGSQPKLPGALASAGDAVVTIKPMQTFLQRLDARLKLAATAPAREPLRVAIVGAGAGGVEIALCLPPRVRKWCGERPLELTLLDRNHVILPGLPAATARFVQNELLRRGAKLVLNAEVQQYRGGLLALADGQCVPADLVLCTTSAEAPAVLKQCGLATDDRGFVQTHPTLEAIDADGLFAVGDCGTIVGAPTPKAGVYAVRQGPVLWDNLRRKVSGAPLTAYRPQRGFLSLLASGDGRAILSYKGRSAHGAWCWRLKDRIDRKFMRMYQELGPAAMPTATGAADDASSRMRCTGCGGKLGGDVLARALKRLPVQPATADIPLGLAAPDDVAILQPQTGKSLAVTTDFFTAMVDDPYLVGRVTAIHAAADLVASGARPQAALALATIPEGPARQQEEQLFQLLAGAVRELTAMGCALVGGHTIEGPQTALGFTVLGALQTAQPRVKSALRPGDALVLTKPLGVGALLVAHAQARCHAEWYMALLDSLTQNHQAVADLFEPMEIQAVTDVTGFGLAGHLLEMLQGSRVGAEIMLADVPLLPGAAELFAAGIESTLAPANRQALSEMHVAASVTAQPGFAALFDPQTSGGLLMGVPPRQVEDCMNRLAALGIGRAAVIGHVVAEEGRAGRLRVV